MAALGALLCVAAAPARVLRVCADPSDLPFSNRDAAGFENRIAALVARDLDARVQFVWWPQRGDFVAQTLDAGRCEVWPGIASGLAVVTTTRPYYRSGYVFVSRAALRPAPASYDDARLPGLTIGVQMVGNDWIDTPPAHALARRGMVRNVLGGRAASPSAIIDAVARGEIDTAVVWGPPAGYFAAHEPVPVTITPVDEAADAGLPMAFDISMAVRRGNTALQAMLDRVLQREQPAIDAILDAYHVPRLAPAGAVAAQ